MSTQYIRYPAAGGTTPPPTITLTSEATGSGTTSIAVTLVNGAVIGKLLTGYVQGAGTITATDSILTAFQKISGNDALKLPLAGGALSGPITGTSASFSSTVTASNLSGTNTGDQTITLTSEATGSGTGSFAVTLTNSAVIGKVLTGYSSGAGTVAATDTILQAVQKLNGNAALALPLAGGTLTGALAGTSATFSGLLGFNATNASAIMNFAGSATLAGGLQIGTWYQQTITSAATGSDNGSIVSGPTIANSVFTCAEFSHFNVNVLTKGASATLTRNNGIKLNSAGYNKGTNNSAITDNASYVGSYFINSSNTADSVVSGQWILNTAGKGLSIKEGSNAKMGRTALTAGSAVVANTSVTAISEIYLTSQVDGGTPGWVRVSARTAATSFTITSSSGTDTSTIGWMIVEPS